MSERTSGYDAARVTAVEGHEAMRKRPGMYVGSTGVRGLHQLVYEVVSRSVNEVLAGGGGCVDVTLTPDGGVRISDDGPGIPFEASEGAAVAGLETLLTRPSTEPRPDGRHTVRWSVYGTGPCAATALSSRLTAEVRRGGARWVQEYARGVALAPPAATGPATDTGTTIAFWPDPDIFDTVECSFAVLARRAREVALLNRGLTLSLTDERPAGGTRAARFRFPDGAGDFVAFLDAEAEVVLPPEVIAFEWEDARMAGVAEAALSWRSASEERVRSFANSAPTPEGGTHVDGFRTGVAAALTAHARRHGLLKAEDPDLGTDRVGEGLTAVVSVRLDRPEFQGSTRGRLGGATVRDGVEQAVREHLGSWLDRHPERAEDIIERITRDTSRGDH